MTPEIRQRSNGLQDLFHYRWFFFSCTASFNVKLNKKKHHHEKQNKRQQTNTSIGKEMKKKTEKKKKTYAANIMKELNNYMKTHHSTRQQ